LGRQHASFQNHIGDHISYSWDEFASALPLAVCNNPSSTYMLMDKGDNQTFTYGLRWRQRVQNTLDAGGSSVLGPHSDGKNIAFVDSHVKWFPSKAIQSRDSTDPDGLNAASPYYATFKN